MSSLRVTLTAILAVVMSLLVGTFHSSTAGTLDPALLSGKFAPDQEVTVIIWLRDQPGFEISQGIMEQFEPALEDIGRQIREAPPGEVERIRQLQKQLDVEHGRLVAQIWSAIRQRIDPDQEAVKTQVEQLGGKAGGKLTVINAIGAIVPFEKLSLVAALPKVSYVELVTEARPLLDISPKAINAQYLWNAHPAETGSYFDFGMVDMGMDKTHPVFAGKDSIHCSPESPLPGWGTANGCQPLDDHATRVAGIAVGKPSDLIKKGVAWGDSGRIFSSRKHVPAGSEEAAFDWIIQEGQAVGDAAEVINHSRGKPASLNPEDYPPDAQFLDAIVDDWPIMVTQAVGNLPADTAVVLEARSFNAIVVGAVDDGNTIPSVSFRELRHWFL